MLSAISRNTPKIQNFSEKFKRMIFVNENVCKDRIHVKVDYGNKFAK